jgi:hypothetical protein
MNGSEEFKKEKKTNIENNYVDSIIIFRPKPFLSSHPGIFRFNIHDFSDQRAKYTTVLPNRIWISTYNVLNIFH